MADADDTKTQPATPVAMPGDKAPAHEAPEDKAAPAAPRPPEIGGPTGPEPTRYGDWERKGRVSDF